MSGREWKPGDVAMATIDGRPTRLFRIEKAAGSDCGWSLSGRRHNAQLMADRTVLEARPLVVIDPENREQVERIVSTYEGGQPISPRAVSDMQAALRQFADPAPSKPEAPAQAHPIGDVSDAALLTRLGALADKWEHRYEAGDHMLGCPDGAGYYDLLVDELRGAMGDES